MVVHTEIEDRVSWHGGGGGDEAVCSAWAELEWHATQVVLHSLIHILMGRGLWPAEKCQNLHGSWWIIRYRPHRTQDVRGVSVGRL